MKTIKTRPGDCVIFDQRLLHAGGVLSRRAPKHAVYLSYGTPNSHSLRHREFFMDRPTYSREIPAALIDRLSGSGLLLED